PRFIETLPRRGYRFIATAEIQNSAATAQPSPVSNPPSELPVITPVAQSSVAPQPRVGKFWLTTASTGIVAAAIFGLYLWRTRPSGANAALQIHSVAVLPLENLSGDPSQEYFADGMTDALTTSLAQLRGIRVISRTSAMHYKGTKKTLP